MSDISDRSELNETQAIHVRYWAAARSAAGCDGDDIPVAAPISLSDVLRQVAKLHPDTRLMAVLDTCSILLGDRPVATEDPDELMVPPGSELQFLPPFAGG
ncbi:thiamine biosynthesis protein ThiS [Nocardioides psychrotolerans]|nr:thiamine biosynthesis protein ThiS [Nocardioides psychrotolerans]